MYSVMPGRFPSLIFRVKVAMATNFKIAAIGLRKIFLAIYIIQFLAIHQWKYLQRFYLASEMFQIYNNWHKIQNGHQNSKWRPFCGKCILIQNTNNLRCCNKVIIECFIYSEKKVILWRGCCNVLLLITA